MPFLIEHFIEHKTKNRAIDFLQFITMHYFHIDKNVVDYAKDMKLPFKVLDTNPVIKFFNSSPHVNLLLKETLFVQHARLKYYSKSMRHFSSFSKIIWHPPRFV